MKKKTGKMTTNLFQSNVPPILNLHYTEISQEQKDLNLERKRQEKNNLVIFTLEMKISTFNNSFDQSEHIHCQFQVSFFIF